MAEMHTDLSIDQERKMNDILDDGITELRRSSDRSSVRSNASVR